MKTHYFIFLIFGSILLLTLGCNKDEGPFLVENSPNDTTTTSSPDSSTTSIDTVYYSIDIQPIWDAYCISCHNETHSQLDLRSCCSYDQIWFTGTNANYIDTAHPGSGNLYRHLTGDLSLMPPSQALPQYELENILDWIDQGGKNN